ncbi:MAG: riboflavin synthase [Nitrospinae bacterium]|nr:riboflavin synthase [Nitrospinota bacterium]
MFSGIVQSLGTVREIHRRDGNARMTVATDRGFEGLELGESVAVNGVCLTVCQIMQNAFAVDMTAETLGRTSFKQVRPKARVNLERALTPAQKVSGHFVAGHIDQTGVVVEIDRGAGETLFRFEHPPELAPYLVEKGSVAVDGISLTVFACRDNRFSVSIIPFTLEHTNLNERKVGDHVNIECDMIGKYVYKACENFLNRSHGPGIDPDFLKRHGFV